MFNPRRILVVEYGKGVLDYLVDFLTLRENCEVHHAPHLLSALAKTNALKPDLMVYNLKLNQAHARSLFILEVCTKHPKTKILAIVQSKNEVRELKALGVQSVLVEPYDLTDLSERIRELFPAPQETALQEHARLLIADDEPEINVYLAELFQPLGFTVHTAQDSESALHTFEINACNLAIVDLKMPRIHGMELIKKLEVSTRPPRPHAIVVITAALGDSLSELRRLGYTIMQKPLDLDELEKLILQDCQKYRLLLGTN